MHHDKILHYLLGGGILAGAFLRDIAEAIVDRLFRKPTP